MKKYFKLIYIGFIVVTLSVLIWNLSIASDERILVVDYFSKWNLVYWITLFVSIVFFIFSIFENKKK